MKKNIEISEEGYVTSLVLDDKIIRLRNRKLTLTQTSKIIDTLEVLNKDIYITSDGLMHDKKFFTQPKELETEETKTNIEELTNSQKRTLIRSKVTRLGETDGVVYPKQIQGMLREAYPGHKEKVISQMVTEKIMNGLLKNDNCWKIDGKGFKRKYIYDRDMADNYLRGSAGLKEKSRKPKKSKSKLPIDVRNKIKGIIETLTRMGKEKGYITPKQVRTLVENIFPKFKKTKTYAQIKEFYRINIIEPMLEEDNHWKKDGERTKRRYLYIGD